MGLLSGGLARILTPVFASFYLDGLLHAGTGDPIYADGGRIVGYAGGVDQPIKVQIDAASNAMRQAVGFAEGDVRMIVLTTYGRPGGVELTPHSDDTPMSDDSLYAQPGYGHVVALNSDMEVTVDGVRYRLLSVERDPALSHWVCRGRRV